MATADELFARVRRGVARERAENEKYLRDGDADWHRLLGKAVDRYERVDATSPLDVEVESTIGDRLDTELMLCWWHAKEGPAFAIRAWAETWRWDPWGHAFENPGEPRYRYGKTFIDSALRPWVRALSPDDYAAAREAAENIRGVAPLTLRCALAHAFPEESAWAEADADEVLALDRSVRHTVFTRPAFVVELLASLRDERRLTALAALVRRESHELTSVASEIARVAGDACVPMLASFIEQEGIAAAIASLGSAPAAAALAARLDSKVVRPVALEFFAAHVALAVPALAHVVAARMKAAEAAGRALVQLATSQQRAFDGARAKLAPEEGRAVDALLDKLAAGTEADASALPPVLRDPPWKRGGRKAKPPPSVALEPLALEESIVWKPGELGEFDTPLPCSEPAVDVATLVGWKNLPRDVELRSKEMDDFVEKAFAKSIPDMFQRRIHFVATMLHACSDAAALRIMNEGDPQKLTGASLHDLEYVLSRFELRALPFFLAFATLQPIKVVDVLGRVRSPRVAPLMADAHVRMKKAGPAARKWLAAFPEHAAAGLIPAAFGAKKTERSHATSALRWLSRQGHGPALRDIAARYGDQARAALDALLAWDPLDDVPAKLAAPPRWLDASALPRPRLRGTGEALPLAAVEHLLAMLQFTPFEPPYAGLSQVKEACAADSIAELGWALFNEWLLAGASGKEDWAFTALAHLGNDETARRLGPHIRAWPGEAAHQRAVKGLDVLAAIGTDVALMHLNGVAQKVKFKGLQEKAREKIAEVAESRGLAPEELADRLVPDLDLDADGSKVLDFGARSFRVGFDEHLLPFVTDHAGKRQKDLPKPNKTDDADKSKAAALWWKGAKKDAKTIAQQELLHLELAMCQSRSWDLATFRRFMLEHPLVVHPVRRLVWARAQGGRADVTFRVAEDRSFADVNDAAVVLGEDARVTIVHRLDLDDALAERWAQRFAEYEIIQPFDQLAREVFRLEPAEKATSKLTRFAGMQVKTGKLLGLEARGWRRGLPQDAGWIWELVKALPDDVEASLGLEGGLLASDMSESPPEQKLQALTLRKRGARSDAPAITFGDLSARSFSELVRDLAQLTRDRA